MRLCLTVLVLMCIINIRPVAADLLGREIFIPSGYLIKGPVCWRIPNDRYKYQALCPRQWEINTIKRKRFEDRLLNPYKLFPEKEF